MFRIAAKIQTFCEVLLTYLSSLVTLFLTIMIVVDVTGRYFFNKPLPATWEIGELCMPYIVFFPFAYALARGNHVRVGLIKNLFSTQVQKIFEIITDIISLLFCAGLTYFAWLRFADSFGLQEEILAPMFLLWWWGKIAMPIGMALFTLGFVFQILFKLTHQEARVS
jgi:TRAP-type C4-dicarboxylate transport system permease small subunit